MANKLRLYELHIVLNPWHNGEKTVFPINMRTCSGSPFQAYFCVQWAPRRRPLASLLILTHSLLIKMNAKQVNCHNVNDNGKLVLTLASGGGRGDAPP